MANRFQLGWKLVLLCGLVVLLSMVLVLCQAGFDTIGLRVVIRLTARISFVIFFLTFSASALVKTWKNGLTIWLIKHRRYLGVSFALIYSYHLTAIIAMIVMTNGAARRNVDDITLTSGIIGYILILAMTATSFDRAVVWLGQRRWQALHRTGILFFWAVFLLTYAGRAVESIRYLPFVILLIGALFLRLHHSNKNRKISKPLSVGAVVGDQLKKIS